jgi:hypothetical protein
MLTIKVVEVILIWVWDVVEIVNLLGGGRLHLGWLWRSGNLFLYLVARNADIAGGRCHIGRLEYYSPSG